MPANPMVPGVPMSPSRQTLTPEIIEQLKEGLMAHGLEPKLYKFDCEGDQIVFRPLLKTDWNEINAFVQANQGNVRQDAIDQKICEKGIMWPQEVLSPLCWDFLRAGMQTSLAKNILARSGFFDPDLDQSNYLRVEPLTHLERGPKPSDEAVAELKGRYHWALKLVLVDTDYYVVRPLNRAEWKQITASEDLDIDLATAERATVWSANAPAAPDFTHTVAGTVRALSEVIMQISGFASVPTVEEL